jgi:hypothetical protein
MSLVFSPTLILDGEFDSYANNGLAWDECASGAWTCLPSWPAYFRVYYYHVYLGADSAVWQTIEGLVPGERYTLTWTHFRRIIDTNSGPYGNVARVTLGTDIDLTVSPPISGISSGSSASTVF